MTAIKSSVLEVGESFTAEELFQKAATHEDIDLYRPCACDLTAGSRVLVKYPLDNTTVAFLRKQGIVWEWRSNVIAFVLLDPASNLIYYFTRGDDHAMSLRVQLTLSEERGGILLEPVAYGGMSQPMRECELYRRFFALFAELQGKGAPLMVRKLATDNIFIPWMTLGLGAMRSSATIFKDFAGDKKVIAKLENSGKDLNPFDPRPSSTHFVVQSAELKLVAAWREQLNEFARSLMS